MRSVALVTSINMAGCACKCGFGSLRLVHRRKFDRSHSDAAVLCAAALVFPSLGQDLRNNQTNAGYPEGFGMVERSSLSFCLSATRKYVQVALVQASLPTKTNQLHVNTRDSISGFLQSRFTNNEQKLNKCSATCTAGVWSTARSTSQQVTKVRTHAHMQSLACPRTHHGQQFSTSAWVRGWYRYFLSLRNPRRRPRVHWPRASGQRALAVAVRSASLEAPAFT